MRILIAVTGGIGLALLVTGLPPLRRIGLEGRVEPFLNGMGGRPADLALTGGTPSLARNVARLMALLFPGPAPDLESRLASAGSELSIAAFRAERALWGLVGACASSASVVAAGGSPEAETLGPASVVGVMVGAMAREHSLRRSISHRVERVRSQLPVAIDLLTLALMAGEEVTAALARVGSIIDGEVGLELRAVVGTIRSGTPPAEALHGLSVRLPHPAARRLVECLTLAMERGAPLSDALRVQADDLRTDRLRDLLVMGGRREVAMLVPVTFLILPTVVAFVLLPGLVSLDLLVP